MDAPTGDFIIGGIDVDASTLGLAAWLVKDGSWALLFPFTALPAAAVALCIEAYIAYKCPPSKQAVRVHSAALVLWLLGNVIWLYLEFFFNGSPHGADRMMPWDNAPLLHGQSEQEYYDRGLTEVRACFLLGVALLLSYYIYCGVVSSVAPPPADDVLPAEDLVYGWFTPEAYHYCFVGPWIIKDYFWSVELLWPAMACGAVVVVLILDVLRRFPSVEIAIELVWVAGNIIWLYGEVGLDEKYIEPRFSAGVLFLLALVALIGSTMQRTRESAASERTPFA